MDDEIIEALYENPFQQHTEILEDICQDEQVEVGHMAVIDEREELVSDLPTEEDRVQDSQDSILECNAVNSAISNQNSDHGDQE